MTLAFKWSRRYEGEGSGESDQCIELFKCSLIFISVVSCRRALIRAPSPRTGVLCPPPGRTAPGPACAATGSTPPQGPGGAHLHRQAPAAPGSPEEEGHCARAEEAVTSPDANLGAWVGEAPGPARPRGWGQSRDISVQGFVSADGTPGARGSFVVGEYSAELQGSGGNVQ